MKWHVLVFALAGALVANLTYAQDGNDVTKDGPFPAVEPAVPDSAKQKLPDLDPSQVTPEMYFYLREQQRYDDPKQAVRRKAELRTAQRMDRMAAMKWYGFSNARPQANPIPFMSSYSPGWMGNGYDRYDWAGAWWPSVSIYVDRSEVRR